MPSGVHQFVEQDRVVIGRYFEPFTWRHVYVVTARPVGRPRLSVADVGAAGHACHDLVGGLDRVEVVNRLLCRLGRSLIYFCGAGMFSACWLYGKSRPTE